MHQVAAAVWNQIAPLAATSWRQAFAMDEDQQTEAMDKLAQELQAKGNDPLVVLAYLELAPLLHERHAVQSFSSRNPNYREALPEVLSANEAALLAMKDHHLNPSQTSELKKLLNEKPTAF